MKGTRVTRQLLTVLVPCKNERKNIRPCLESVRDLADELLVADSGSTDGTLAIVREIGNCRVIRRDYVNSADFKNWAIPQARHPWVLIVDADERVPEPLAREIREILENPPEDMDAFSCDFQDFFMGHPLRYAGWDSRSIRLIRRDVCRYQMRRVHADVVVDPNRVGKLKTRIPHYSVWDYNDFILKYARYTTWASDDLWEKGRRSSFFGLTLRPVMRFLHLYLIRGGFLDGIPGLQVCAFFTFLSTYMKQAKLWQREFGLPQPDPEEQEASPTILAYPESTETPDAQKYRRAA
ncbi:MAG: glycosyltransferase family 2 protein [Pirellulaceae bacterium]|nr:glycosyltransferase family 2 protein [Pirellulaceae bacterium]